MSKEEILLKELTRLLLHIAPDVEPASDVVDVYWQVDNAVCGLLTERHLTQLAVDGAGVYRQVNHVFIEGVCAECGAVETRPTTKANRWADAPPEVIHEK